MNPDQELYEKLMQDISNQLSQAKSLSKLAHIELLKNTQTIINNNLADLNENESDPNWDQF